jgi:hypothetical protein
MGLSTAYGNIVLIILFLSCISLLVSVYASNMGGMSSQVGSQGDVLGKRLATSVKISSIATSTTDDFVRFYVINSGREPLEVGCTDFYIDRQWVKPSDMVELTLLNTTFSPGVWDPSEWLKMRTQYLTEHDVPHEGRIVTCNGVSDSMVFWWAT